METDASPGFERDGAPPEFLWESSSLFELSMDKGPVYLEAYEAAKKTGFRQTTSIAILTAWCFHG